MNIITWIVFGIITGIIANLVDPAPSKGGLLGVIVLGILGSVLGGLLASLIFGIEISQFNFTSLAVAVLGSLILLFVQRLFVTREENL